MYVHLSRHLAVVEQNFCTQLISCRWKWFDIR